MNKKILRTLTALCAALMLSGGFSVTAFAQTPEGEDDTNDSGVVYEEPQKEEPLTPDGNATLVDDFGGNKQLITVTTKNGNYFYILIDRDDEGENTVHFLNQVDEADLLALMEDGSTEAAPPAVCSCTDKCEAGKVNVSCPVCKDNMTACSGKEAEPETEEPPELPKEKGNAGGLVLFLFTKAWNVPAALDLTACTVIAAIVLFGTAVGFSVFLESVQYIGPVKSTLIGCLEPVSSMVFSVAALKTQISWAEWIGFVLILCTVFLSVSEKEDG